MVDESFVRNQDIDFMERALEQYKLAYIDVQVLTIHVRHPKLQISKNPFLDQQYFLKKDKTACPSPLESVKKCLSRLSGKLHVRILDEKGSNPSSCNVENVRPVLKVTL